MKRYEVVRSMNNFAISLYQRLSNKAEKNANIFFGPASIYSALAMVYAGTREETAKELKAALCLKEDSENFHEMFAKVWVGILKANNLPNGCSLDVANRIWIKENHPIEESYLNELKLNYKADAVNVDFFNDVESARRQINKWIENNTKDKIMNMMGPGSLSQSTSFLVTNAMYFYGEWRSAFEVKDTRTMPFYTLDGTVEVDMMYQKDNYGYTESEYYDCKVLVQPYRNSTLKMMIILPNKNDGITKLEEMLANDKYNGEYMWDWTELGHKDVHFYLPKFRISEQTDVVEHLIDLGVGQLFSKADLSGITKTKDLCVSGISHAAYIDVNEKGTEIAVCTTSNIVKAGISRVVEVKVDHPFLLMVVDTDSEVILFWGKVCKPFYGS